METTKLKRFAQYARRSLMEQVHVKLDAALSENSAVRREKPQAVADLEAAVQESGKDQVIERAAYTWFNRFCALRFMDVNRYNRINVVSPADPGQFQPEILAEAKGGHIDENLAGEAIRRQVFALLDGKAPGRDPQGEAYRLLVVAACNALHRAMPFLFQRIDDYTELLLPDDLLSGNSILAYTREAMTPEACQDVEVIGWLYQFYISEKKDEVFAGLKKNKKITPENIPAATQLFTPHWIVRYLVENSLGRLWLLNRPESKLIEQMEYYIRPEQQETDFLRVESPEEIRVCDPACGSGHMLTYAFDVLYAIYEEEGYDPAEIPEKILTQNLYGIEIDERAGELAAFALTMKARAKHKRFFSKGIRPNICVLKNIRFEGDKLKQYMDFVGRDLFTLPLQGLLRQFEEADNFGSLIRPMVTDVAGMLRILETKDVSGQLFLHETHEKVVLALRQADYLSPKYHVVIANPPYMGGRGMNGRLGAWIKDNYPNSKLDLFAAFIERNIDLLLPKCYVAQITMETWMFLSSYEALRNKIIKNSTIISMGHFPYDGKKPTVMGINFGTTAFILTKNKQTHYKGVFYCSHYYELEEDGHPIHFPTKNERYKHASISDFEKIPGYPIAYWVSNSFLNIFSDNRTLGDKTKSRQGLATGDNSIFARFWYEVSINKFCTVSESCEETNMRVEKWYPYNKGGDFRRWYGNIQWVVNWQHDGKLIRNFRDEDGKLRSRPQNTDCYFHDGITWSDITSGNLSVRLLPKGCIYDISGHSAFPKEGVERNSILAYLNTNFAKKTAKILNPTLHFQIGDYQKFPYPELFIRDDVSNIASFCIALSRSDWNSYETSWDFTSLPLLAPDYRQPTLKATYQTLRAHWQTMTQEMQRLEEENNRIFIDVYGLQDELTPDVPLAEITLTCNPHYRYGVEECEVGSGEWEEMEARLLQDTMKELVSYAVGCMFGRYSLDMPGLVLANQGEDIEDYYKKIDGYHSDERKKLSGTDRVAEGDEVGGVDLSGDTAIPQGRALRFNEPNSQGGSFNSLEHSGRSGETIDSGVQKLSFNRAGFPGGSGNATADCSTSGLPSAGESRTNPQPVRGNQAYALFPDREAVLTSHSPLPTSHFAPDEDNVIPILDGDWFTDDIAEQFKKFLKVTFGPEHYEENLRFVEAALGKDIRKYFLKDFYADHVKRYKKRPIYWLFSSPKGSFNALIYLHRYRPDTASIVLNNYLREFRAKLEARKNHLEAVNISADSSQGEKTKAIKEIEKIRKTLAELDEYEREILYPLATEQLAIDLDDGVKANYPKFGAALKKIPGLEAAED